MCARSELLLFLASRAQLVESVIKKALSEGKVVVADRFAHSSVAYQGCGRGLGVETVEMLNNFATGMIYPEIVFLIDIPVEFVLDRLKNSGESDKDRIEKEEIEFWGKVRRCYLKMAKEHEEFLLIDGTKSIEEMQEKIIEEFEKRYGGDNSSH
jgi:dTMP kinase